MLILAFMNYIFYSGFHCDLFIPEYDILWLYLSPLLLPFQLIYQWVPLSLSCLVLVDLFLLLVVVILWVSLGLLIRARVGMNWLTPPVAAARRNVSSHHSTNHQLPAALQEGLSLLISYPLHDRISISGPNFEQVSSGTHSFCEFKCE